MGEANENDEDGITLAALIELFIALEIIPPDKAAEARSILSSS